MSFHGQRGSLLAQKKKEDKNEKLLFFFLSQSDRRLWTSLGYLSKTQRERVAAPLNPTHFFFFFVRCSVKKKKKKDASSFMSDCQALLEKPVVVMTFTFFLLQFPTSSHPVRLPPFLRNIHLSMIDLYLGPLITFSVFFFQLFFFFFPPITFLSEISFSFLVSFRSFVLLLSFFFFFLCRNN